MEENLPEECGNYISPNVSDSEESDGFDDAAQGDDSPNDDVGRMGVTTEDGDDTMDMDDEVPGTVVVLHEDKKYYATAEEVYCADVKTLVIDEDA
jgi:116 kDa U5 small nuclear ribonucleoprotein component